MRGAAERILCRCGRLQEGIAERGAEGDLGSGDVFRGGLQPAEPDAERADAFGVGVAQPFELRTAQAEGLCRGGLLAQPCAVVVQVGGQGRLILFETPVLAPVMAQGAEQQRRDGECIEEECFFHGFGILRNPER